MRFLSHVLLFSFLLSSAFVSAAENTCMRVNTRSSDITVMTSRGSGSVCGKVQAGQNLFMAGDCRADGYCPISFREGACENNDGGIGWIRKQGDNITKCIVDADGLMTFQLDDSRLEAHREQTSCYQVNSRVPLKVSSSISSGSKSCGRLADGVTFTPAGACGDFYCPMFFYNSDTDCKGIGYVYRGKMNSRYVAPCSAEVSNQHTRRQALNNASRGAGGINYGSGGELARSEEGSGVGGYVEPTTADYQSGAGSLSFIRRCHTANCNKAANAGHTINFYNGCSGDIRFGSQSPTGSFYCDSSIAMNQNMQPALTGNLSSCVRNVAKQLNLGDVKSMNVVTSGCFVYRNVRNGSTLSQHASGSAIDVNSITLNFTAGGSQTISMHINNRSRDGRFHDLLYQCWNRIGGSCSASLTHNSARCGDGLGGSRNLLDLHRDHMHLTYNCRRGGGC